MNTLKVLLVLALACGTAWAHDARGTGDLYGFLKLGEPQCAVIGELMNHHEVGQRLREVYSVGGMLRSINQVVMPNADEIVLSFGFAALSDPHQQPKPGDWGCGFNVRLKPDGPIRRVAYVTPIKMVFGLAPTKRRWIHGSSSGWER